MRNRFDLTGKKALITGGGRGLGRAFALALAEAGADVAVASRDRRNCEEVAGAIRALGRKGYALTVDMADWSQIDQLTIDAFGLLGGIDILVNNAGQTSSMMPLGQVTQAYFDEVYAINVRGPLRLAAKTVELVDQRNGLSIINVSSMGARRLVPSSAVYSSSKAAIETVTQIMALEWVAQGVRVNAIAPGPIKTDMLTAVEAQMPGVTAVISETVPMKRVADPDEMVGALLYLASDASTYATGTVVSVNGGW